MAARTGWVIFGIILIIIIIIIAIVAIVYITEIGAIVSTPFAPQGSIVQLRNLKTGNLLGICTIGTVIICNEGNMTGDYASTSPNQSNPDTMKWQVNVDPTTQFVALQNVATSKYLTNTVSSCTKAAIAGNLLSVQQTTLTSATTNVSGWFGSSIPSANSAQLFVLNQEPGQNTYVGTTNGNSFDNTCNQMVSDGFNQVQINETTWGVEIVSQ